MASVLENTGLEPDKKYSEYQSLLCKLPGVSSARFVLDENGTARELHVLADLSKNPKQLARDIQSALLAAFSFSLDHRMISIAQIDTGSRFVLPSALRLVCEQVSLTTAPGSAQCQVTLSLDRETYVGSSSSSGLSYSRQRMVAEATLAAIHQFLGRQGVFSLVDVKLTDISSRQAVLVTVGYDGGGRCSLLLGAVCLEDDINTAIVKSTLDAVNRRLFLCAR